MSTKAPKLETNVSMEEAVSYPNSKLSYRDVGVSQGGTKIIIPDGMTPKEAVIWLQRKENELNQPVEFSRIFKAHPIDVANALTEAISEEFGWTGASTKVIQTFFGPMEIQPKIINVDMGGGKSKNVVWGLMMVPGINAKVEVTSRPTPREYASGTVEEGTPLYGVVQSSATRRDEARLNAICDRMESILRTKSLFRGRPFKLKGPFAGDPERSLPEFLDSVVENTVFERDVVLPVPIENAIRDAVLTPIRNAERLRKNGIPIKRGVLLFGKYGCGKTLTALSIAHEAIKKGWTFIYLTDPSCLHDAFIMAKQYSPCVIFCEDIDSIFNGEERNERVNAVLNTIDGIDTKSQEIMCVFTSNHPERISSAFRRPGRLDAVVEILPPDAEAAQRLMRKYGQFEEGTDLAKVGRQCDGFTPAMIREVVERAKLSAIGRTPDDPEDGVTLIAGSDLQVALTQMEAHRKLCDAKAPVDPTELEKAFKVIGTGIGVSFKSVMSRYSETLTNASRMADEEDDFENRLLESSR